jgi:hypothetical protein
MQEQSDDEGTKNEEHEGYEGFMMEPGLGNAAYSFYAGLVQSLACPSCEETDGGGSIGCRHEDGRSRATYISFLGRLVLLFSLKWIRNTIDVGAVQRDGFQGIQAGLGFRWVIVG